MSAHINEHISRCIELYGQPGDTEITEHVERGSYEQMRADLMIAIGMLMAIDRSATATRTDEVSV